MKLLLLLLFCFTFSYSFDVEVFSSNVKNGGIALLEFRKNNSIKYRGVTFKNKRFDIVENRKDTNKLYSLIPFSYYEKLGAKELEVEYFKNGKMLSEKLHISVVNGAYKKENIEVSNSKVNPTSKDVKERISKEYIEAMSIYNSVTPTSYISTAFTLPLDSIVTSSFGKARVYNGSLKGYHSGTDFRAKIPTPVMAANNAKVALVKNRFYSGGTVLLDHGKGVYTCYFHMSQFYVEKGELVKKGQTLGLSGKSGRVTGPHLHFSARINGVQVDPLQLISLMNDNLLKGS